MNLRDYINFRTLELDYEDSQIGQPGDLSMGSVIAKRETIQMARRMLRELECLAAWIDAGEPAVFEPPLSDDEKAFWEKAKARGVKVPADIEAQL